MEIQDRVIEKENPILYLHIQLRDKTKTKEVLGMCK